MYSPHVHDHDHSLDLDAALDFLNTRELENGQLVDHLHQPGDAIGWFVEHGVLHDGEGPAWTAADLRRVKAARDALHEVVDAVVEDRRPTEHAVETVNAALRMGVVPQLECDGRIVKIGHRHGASAVDDAISSLAAPILEELASGKPDRFRICANETCRWTFYDASPTGRRRWCNMQTCGNRAKAARHRARAKQQTQPIQLVD
jgi:predicted RNA-binding Zn ribbon-like protein